MTFGDRLRATLAIIGLDDIVQVVKWPVWKTGNRLEIDRSFARRPFRLFLRKSLFHGRCGALGQSGRMEPSTEMAVARERGSSHIRASNAFIWPRLGPRGPDVVTLHVVPDSKHSPQLGLFRSHFSFRRLHSSHALPGLCRECGVAVVLDGSSSAGLGMTTN